MPRRKKDQTATPTTANGTPTVTYTITGNGGGEVLSDALGSITKVLAELQGLNASGTLTFRIGS